MIWYFKPYSFDKDLGKAYNQYCELVPNDEDWICLMDGDSMFLNSNFGHIIQEYINQYPECKLFLPVVNRIGKSSQCYKGLISSNPDIVYHRKIAKRLIEEGRQVKSLVKDPNLSISMPCFIFQKKTWKAVGGFDETQRILGVDVRFSEKVRKLKAPIYLMENLYLFHYYRLLEGKNDKSHIMEKIPDKMFYINLDEAVERRARCEQQFKKHGLDVERVVGEPGGMQGCTQSHLKCIRMAKERGYDSILIFEDDVVLERNFTTYFYNFLKQVSSDWSLIYLGGYHMKRPERCTNNIYRVKATLSTHAYIIRKNLFDKILDTFGKKDVAIDREYVELQPSIRAYCMNPHLAWQADGYSYTMGKETKPERLTRYFNGR
jgi:glycosyl transferase, family 25